jgi:hypothetical protein
MTPRGLVLKTVLVALLTTAFIQDRVYGQKVESETARIRISNLPDSKPPEIILMTPVISGDMIYRSETQELDIIGEVKDESGVKFVSVNSDIRTINEAGIFSSQLMLNPGVNRIRLMASDNRDNMQEQYIMVQYLPTVETLADKIIEKSKYYALII